MDLLAWLYWDPNPDAFTIPFTHRPIKWYGIFFALGFLLCYIILVSILSKRLAQSKVPLMEPPKQLAKKLIDRLAWYIFIGVVIGARLGNAIFYDWDYYKNHLLEIFAFWEPGLASHGAILGIMVALFIYYWRNKQYYGDIGVFEFTDIFCIAVPIACACIRMGNFMNQEILGNPSEVPWAIIFGHPIDGSGPIPRHPVQLYEAIAYFSVFLILITLWYFKRNTLRAGVYTGLALVLCFSARFYLEFFKTSQTYMIDESVINMGQYLSVPFILFGLYLLFFRRNICLK